MNVLITGSSSGIGLTTAKLLYRCGHSVYGLSDSYANVTYLKQVKADVSDSRAVKDAIKNIVNKAGHIDCLILCAGVSLASPAEKTAMKDAKHIFHVNFWGYVHVLHEVLPLMKKNKKGQIIMVSSIAGLFPIPFLSYYSASKSAILSYGCALAGELKRFHIPVTTVLPGGVRTQFTRKRKIYKDNELPSLKNAILSIGKEEQQGMSPAYTARSIVQILKMKNPPVTKIIGVKYKAYGIVRRIFPLRTTQYFIRKKYT